MNKRHLHLKSDKNKRRDKQSGQVFTIINFNPRIQHNYSLIKKSFSNEERPIHTREFLQTSNSHLYRDSFRHHQEKRAHSSNQLRLQLFGEFCNVDILNEERDNMSSLMKEKMSELRGLSSNRKSALSRRNDQDTQVIHFSEYVIQSNSPSSVLHSRNKQAFPFMKPAKIRSLVSRSMEGRNKDQTDQLFQSIELNSNGKYAVSRRIVLSGQNISNNIKETKSRGLASYGTKAYLQQRKAKMVKGKKVTQLINFAECKPWQTHGEHPDDDPCMLNH